MINCKQTTSLIQLYNEWVATTEHLRNKGIVIDDAWEHKAKQLEELETQIAAWPSRTLHDLALKVVVCDGDGDMSLNPNHEIVAKEARTIVERGM